MKKINTEQRSQSLRCQTLPVESNFTYDRCTMSSLTICILSVVIFLINRYHSGRPGDIIFDNCRKPETCHPSYFRKYANFDFSDHVLAIFITNVAFLVDGNVFSNLLSVGEKSVKTGPDDHTCANFTTRSTTKRLSVYHATLLHMDKDSQIFFRANIPPLVFNAPDQL